MSIESLPILILNPHSRCNCRCAMCDIWKTTAVQEIAAGDLKFQLASIERLGVQWVVFSGGEPLMHSDLWSLTSPLRERKIRITLLSSGLLLGRYAESIVDQVDDVIVSLDGPPEVHNRVRGVPGAFGLLAAGVERIRALRTDFSISARCTVQRANCSRLVATVRCARELGLASVSFLAADLDSSAFNHATGLEPRRQAEIVLGWEDLATLESEIEALISQNECGGFVLESPAKLRKIADHFRCRLSGDTPKAPLCNAPWKSAVVEADGTVKPCFFHRPIGRLNSGTPLAQILNGPEALAFRNSLDVATNPVCRKCVCSLNWSDTVRPNEDPTSEPRPDAKTQDGPIPPSGHPAQ
jgi:MoaA/NifB/PqqE/SkfB family radical SAM enzyme